jgi:hypothetical protein
MTAGFGSVAGLRLMVSKEIGHSWPELLRMLGRPISPLALA